jgi:hypothetical protein
VDVVYHEYAGQIHAFISLTKAIPQGMTCTFEVGDYLKERLGRLPAASGRRGNSRPPAGKP